MGARRATIASGLAVMIGLALAPHASALDHAHRVREVFTGTAGSPTAQYVALQAFANSQNLVTGNKVVVFDGSETVVGTFTFAADAASTATSQRFQLIATSDAAAFFGITPDLTMTPVLSGSGGKACYEDVDNPTAGVIDCVSWGNYSGSATGTGTPFNAPDGILSGLSALRDTSGGTNAAGLDAGDDTNDSAADFDHAIPAPTNFAGNVTTTTGEASVTGSTLSFAAAAGVANRLQVSRAPGFFVLTDNAAPISAGTGCERLTVNSARCPMTGLTTLAIDSGDMIDSISTPNGINVTVNAGAGNDRVTTRNGNDLLSGGLGNDVLNGGFGADDYDGGDGLDRVNFAGRAATDPVTVTIGAGANDGSANDQSGGRRDDVMATIEQVIGGKGGDSLTGSALRDRLTGGLGADELHGLGSNDLIRANGDGAIDTITCGAGGGDRLFADVEDNFPTAGADACEIVN